MKESKERGIEDRQRMQKEIEQMKSWTRLRKQPVQKTSAHIGNFIENNLHRDDFSLCAACLWMEIVGVVARYAPGKNLNVCRLPRPPKVLNEQKLKFFW